MHKRICPIAVYLFVYILAVNLLEHWLIFQFLNQSMNTRNLSAAFLGVSFDLMIAAGFACLSLGLFFLPPRWQKSILFVFCLVYTVLLYTDWQYVQEFNTHLPFTHFEYLNDLNSLAPSALAVIQDSDVLILVLVPLLLLGFALWRLKPWRFQIKSGQDWQVLGISVAVFFLVSLVFGNYGNSYVGKNIHNPSVSNMVNYFDTTFNNTFFVPTTQPTQALLHIQNLQQEPQQPPATQLQTYPPATQLQTYPPATQLQTYPWIHPPANHCSPPSTELAASLCVQQAKQPNILFLLLESFRAQEIGFYGSDLGLTPELDSHLQHSVVFKNFFSNGYQTRHAQVSIYCSLIPHFGQPIMLHYANNEYLCLPQVLADLGYETSFIFAQDLLYDNQFQFFKKNGVQELRDQFDFPKNAEKLGWGYSDKALYDYWLAFLDEQKEPFFSTALTITNHHPFEVPAEFALPKIYADQQNYLEAFRYTSLQLLRFLEQAKTKDWYNNTLIFILADTGNGRSATRQPKKRNQFENILELAHHIPLWVTGGLIQKPLVVTQYASQIDLSPTVLDMLGIQTSVPWAGRSMLVQKNQPVPIVHPYYFWAMLTPESQVYATKEADSFAFHFFGAPQNWADLQKLGESFQQATPWLLQNNLYWPKQTTHLNLQNNSYKP